MLPHILPSLTVIMQVVARTIRKEKEICNTFRLEKPEVIVSVNDEVMTGERQGAPLESCSNYSMNPAKSTYILTHRVIANQILFHLRLVPTVHCLQGTEQGSPS